MTSIKQRAKIKLTPAGKRFLRISDISVAIAGVVAILVVAYIILQKDVFLSEPVIFTLWVITAIFAAQTLFLAIAYMVVSGSKVWSSFEMHSDEPRLTTNQPKVVTKKSLRASRVAVFYSLFVIWAISGWTIVMQNQSEEGIVWAGIFLPPFLALFGLLIGAMMFLLGLLPLKFLYVSFKELVAKRSLAALGGIVGAAAVLGLGSLIFLMPMAIDTHRPGVPGQMAMLFAMLGLPGSYSVIDENLLLTGRIITWSAIAIFVTIWIVSRSRKSRNQKDNG